MKINGHRVELPEIETALLQHPEVRQVCVDFQAESGLTAYLVRNPQHADQHADWKSLLQGRLPSHMLPARYIECETMPLTANGKLDLTALRQKARESDTHVPAAAPALNSASAARSMQDCVAGLWAEVLQSPVPMPPEQNFFEAGADSIHLLRLRAGLERELQRSISTILLFHYPSVHLLSDYLERSACTHHLRTNLLFPAVKQTEPKSASHTASSFRPLRPREKAVLA